MKKFFCLLAAFALLMGTTACKDETISFEYNFNITGTATGNVDVTFPGGGLVMKGDSYISLDYASAPAAKAKMGDHYVFRSLDSLRNSGDRQLIRIADQVQSDYNDAFTATSADGTYYLHITGFVKEKLTGIEVKIDKTLTNEEPAQAPNPDYKSE